MLSMILYLASRCFSLPEPNTPACEHQQSCCVQPPLFFFFLLLFWVFGSLLAARVSRPAGTACEAAHPCAPPERDLGWRGVFPRGTQTLNPNGFGAHSCRSTGKACREAPERCSGPGWSAGVGGTRGREDLPCFDGCAPSFQTHPPRCHCHWTAPTSISRLAMRWPLAPAPRSRRAACRSPCSACLPPSRAGGTWLASTRRPWEKPWRPTAR